MKNFHFPRHALFLIGILSFLVGCQPPKKGEGPAIDLFTKCEQLQSSNQVLDTNFYLIRFNDKDKYCQEVTEEKKQAIIDKLTNQGSFPDEVVKKCPCGNLFLIKKNPNVSLESREQTAQSETEPDGSGSVSKFYRFNIQPLKPLPPIDSVDQFPEDTCRIPSQSVIVGIIDLGIEYSHQDIFPSLWTNNVEYVGTPGVDDDNNCVVDDKLGYNFNSEKADDLMDFTGHGTHVAGIMTLKSSSGRYYKNQAPLRLISTKIADGNQQEADLFSAICAMDYLIDQGASVINTSWGFYGEESKPLREVIQKAKDHGVLVVASAGNDGMNTDLCAHWPSGYAQFQDNVISVAALEQGEGGLASWTNFGANTVDIAAPGEEVCSTIPGNAFGNMSGTSMAAPFVSRYAAILKSENPGWDYLKLRQEILVNTAKDIGDPRIRTKSKIALSNDLNCNTP